MNSLEPLETNLRHLSDADLILAVDIIVEKGEAHSGLQGVPEDVPGPAVLKPCNVDFAASVKATATGEDNPEEHDARRTTLLEYVTMWGQYIVMRCKMRKDPSLLENTGFAPRHPRKAPVRANAHKEPTPVPHAKVKRGDEGKGEFIFGIDCIPGNGTYQMRYTTDPNDDTAWKDGGQSPYCRFRQDGFTLGKKYFFSFRYHGPNGASDWSPTIGIFAA